MQMKENCDCSSLFLCLQNISLQNNVYFTFKNY